MKTLTNQIETLKNKIEANNNSLETLNNEIETLKEIDMSRIEILQETYKLYDENEYLTEFLNTLLTIEKEFKEYKKDKLK